MKVKVTISVNEKGIKLPTGARLLIRKACIATLKYENFENNAEIDVTIVGDEKIKEINNEFRNIDKATDVLSFPMFEFEPGNPPSDWVDYQDPASGLVPLGDMCISLERAIAQAKEFGHSVKREVGYLTIHSMLHLLGYDHETSAEDETYMIEKQKQILRSVF